MPFTAILFPGKIEPSEGRPVEKILSEWIDSEGNLNLTPDVKIAPTRVEPSTQLVFRKTTSADGITSYTFLGSTSRVETFTQLADFVYTPPVPSSHIYTQCISKHVNPQQYNFEANPCVATIEAKLAAKEELGDVSSVAFLRFRDNSGPPQQPTQFMLNQQQQDDELVKRVRDLFESRPIWQRAALEEALGDSSAGVWRFSHAIRLCSYLFLDGPWRKCYVRFGYDPRTNCEAKRLQMIDFRDPFFKAGGDEAKSTNVDIHFRRPPSNRSQLYQLCDIEDPGIQALLAGETKQEMADAHTGWLTEAEMDSIRNQMKIKSESMRRHDR